jgi:hypothetical protein
MTDATTQALATTQPRLPVAFGAVAVSFPGVALMPQSWAAVYAVAHEMARQTLLHRWLAQHQPGLN